jgi:hypothetical protein
LCQIALAAPHDDLQQLANVRSASDADVEPRASRGPKQDAAPVEKTASLFVQCTKDPLSVPNETLSVVPEHLGRFHPKYPQISSVEREHSERLAA